MKSVKQINIRLDIETATVLKTIQNDLNIKSIQGTITKLIREYYSNKELIKDIKYIKELLERTEK